MSEEKEPLLFPGHKAEWIILGPVSRQEQEKAALVRLYTDKRDAPHADLQGDGLFCGGPHCENILRPGDRVLLVTRPGRRGAGSRMWFCSAACQRKNHFETISHAVRSGKYVIKRRTR